MNQSTASNIQNVYCYHEHSMRKVPIAVQKDKTAWFWKWFQYCELYPRIKRGNQLDKNTNID